MNEDTTLCPDDLFVVRIHIEFTPLSGLVGHVVEEYAVWAKNSIEAVRHVRLGLDNFSNSPGRNVTEVKVYSAHLTDVSELNMNEMF